MSGLLQLPEYIEAVSRGGRVHEPDLHLGGVEQLRLLPQEPLHPLLTTDTRAPRARSRGPATVRTRP
ncbi:hypothetical protein [Nocardiopsis sp. CNT312]|uniref:hypothetical protein n=1 Tax=Nocardiopsis sp. CNT312 TaxID=1137268 RepID=UPI003510ADCA